MLFLEIQEKELFDEETDRFIKLKPQIIKLEHSLVSISKWESKWKKPFLEDSKKTKKELLDYISCMLVGQLRDDAVVSSLSVDDLETIINYINDPMTATTVNYFEEPRAKKQVITSELIYYWMIAAGIPFECEKWHLNRLLTLIKVCGAKSQSDKKINPKKYAKSRAMLNAERRAKLKSKG